MPKEEEHPPLAVKGHQICQSWVKNLDNRVFNGTKLAHARHLTRVFHPILINLVPLDTKEGSFLDYFFK